MATTTQIRFDAVTDTIANIALDDYQGRQGFATDAVGSGTLRINYDGTNIAYMARRNGANSFSGGTQLFPDTLFRLADDGDASKLLAFQLSGITTATTRTLTIPDANGTIVTYDSSEIISLSTSAKIRWGTDLYVQRDVSGALRITSDGVSAAADVRVLGELQTNGDVHVGNNLNVTVDSVLSGSLTASGAQYVSKVIRAGSASTGASDFIILKQTTSTATETLPASTGSGRVLYFQTITAYDWTIQCTGSDIFNSGYASTVLNASGYFAMGIVDSYPGLWSIFTR